MVTTEAAKMAADTTVDDLKPLIGQTPLLQIDYRFDGHLRRLFAKYEQENTTGSIKDRMAEYILRTAYESGALRRGDTIAEASSGNTGISFAALGRALGHAVRVYMPSWMSPERVGLIRAFGAEIVPISLEEGGFLGCIRRAQEYATTHEHVFLPRQFENQANIGAHYESTGPEIEGQLAGFGRKADAFIAGVGTGGTVMGVGRYLRRNGARVKVHPLEPTNSPTMRTGCKLGAHRIQGISDEFVPSILKLAELDEVVDIWDGDAILMAQELCCRLGLAVGISSGANFLGAAGVVEQMGGDVTVVTVFADSNKKYLSTDLCHDEPVRAGYMSPRVELLRFKAIRLGPAGPGSETD